MTVELVHKCIQQLHLLALHFEILGYIPGLLNGLEYLRRTGDFSGDNIKTINDNHVRVYIKQMQELIINYYICDLLSRGHEII